MRAPDRGLPVAVLTCVLFLVLVAGSWAARPPHRADVTVAAAPAADVEAGKAPRSGRAELPERTSRASEARMKPFATKGGGWSGYAFDACRAPGQRTMDRWLRTSPFLGVGIYLGGIHRACEQRHLDRGWVNRQTRAGWQLLPIWVGPQAACTGYRHRIVNRPGPKGGYGAARAGGIKQARLAASAARRLGIGGGQTIFYDIEPFSTDRLWCRMSALTFLDAWTREIRRQGYRSGVYSHVRAAVAMLSRAPGRYARPDAVWYAWISGSRGVMPRKYIANTAFMRTSRVHQFALDRRVRFGGISMDIDWNYVTLGGAAHRSASAPCGRRADRVPHRFLDTGARGRAVSVVQCLLAAADRDRGPVDGVYGERTARAVRAYQRARGLRRTGAVDRRTWTALLAEGRSPVLKKGSAGEPVRRLQRSLNAALRHDIAVDGAFGPATEGAVRRYQRHLDRERTGVVTGRTWQAFGNGRVAVADAEPETKTRTDRGGNSGKADKEADRKRAKKRGKADRRHGRDRTRGKRTDRDRRKRRQRD